MWSYLIRYVKNILHRHVPILYIIHVYILQPHFKVTYYDSFIHWLHLCNMQMILSGMLQPVVRHKYIIKHCVNRSFIYLIYKSPIFVISLAFFYVPKGRSRNFSRRCCGEWVIASPKWIERTFLGSSKLYTWANFSVWNLSFYLSIHACL